MLDIMGFELSLSVMYWTLLAIGMLLLTVSVMLDGLFHFGDDGSVMPIVGLFLGLFGAVGILTRSMFGMGDGASVITSLVASGVGAATAGAILLKAIRAQEKINLSDRREDMIGKNAEVTLTIQPGETGQITYITDSGRSSAPARAADAAATIRQGTPVKVVECVGTTFVVEPAFGKTA